VRQGLASACVPTIEHACAHTHTHAHTHTRAHTHTETRAREPCGRAAAATHVHVRGQRLQRVVLAAVARGVREPRHVQRVAPEALALDAQVGQHVAVKAIVVPHLPGARGRARCVRVCVCVWWSTHCAMMRYTPQGVCVCVLHALRNGETLCAPCPVQ